MGALASEGSRNTNKTVKLLAMKRRKSPLIQLLVIMAFVGCLVLLHYQDRLGLIGIGVLSIVIAVMVESRSSRIWKNYRRNYQPGKNKLVNVLSEPKPLYNMLNVYVLWPAVFLLGIYALYVAWHLG